MTTRYDKRIEQLTSKTSLAEGDLFVIGDSVDKTSSNRPKQKKILFSNIINSIRLSLAQFLLPGGGTSNQVLKKSSAEDYDVEWGVGGSSGTGISVTTNIVRVDPNADEEIEEKLYLTYADALDFVLSQYPTADNPWMIELPCGEFSEDIEFNEFVNIKGNRTLLTGTLTTSYEYTSSILGNTTYIESCIITDLNISSLSGTIPLIFTYNCILDVSTIISQMDIVGGIINRECILKSGDFSSNIIVYNFNSMILGGEYGPELEGFGAALKCDHCQMYGGTYNGGKFTQCNISSELDSTVVFNAGIYYVDNCSYNLKDDVDIDINSEINVFNNCSFKRFTSGEGNNNLIFGANSGNIATFNNCYFENMDVTHTNTPSTRGTLNLNNCSGSITYNGNTGALTKVCKNCFYDDTPKTATAFGVPQQVTLSADGSCIYFCIEEYNWKKIPLDVIE